MICYHDMTFCATDCTQETCRRFITTEHVENAEAHNLPFALSDFSVACLGYKGGREDPPFNMMDEDGQD